MGEALPGGMRQNAARVFRHGGPRRISMNDGVLRIGRFLCAN